MAHLYFGLPKLVFLDMRYKFFYNIAVVESISAVLRGRISLSEARVKLSSALDA